MSGLIGDNNSENILYKTIITYLLASIPLFLFGQETENISVEKTMNPVMETNNAVVPIPDSLRNDTITTDTISIDTLALDSIGKQVIDAPIDYDSEDSIIVSLDGQRVFLYNNAKVTYQQIELTAYYIELNLDTKEIFAEGIKDSTGTLVQKPYFKQGSEEFESETMRYNFDTQKAFITKVVTEQGEGRILSDRTKKIDKDIFITEKAKYTTCDAEHPHFYLQLSKAKVISNNKIITGPAYLVLEDFPIYFPFLPFGYFPSTPTYSSGIIIPKYGEEQNRGFFLREGGYYWAAGQYFDLAVLGDIYSKGSWAFNVHTNYSKRYKFSGNFDFKYALNKYGETGTDTYSRKPSFQVLWSHRQDPKANPNRTFSASVTLSANSYDRQNSYEGNFNRDNYLRTQKSSSISYTQRFENTPFNMSVNLTHSQNAVDTTISLTLPELTFSMTKVYPFRKKNRSGPLRFYEKFGINYSFNMRNNIEAKEYDLFKKRFPGDWKNGIKHNIPISFPSFNLFNYINVNPTFSYNEKWYFHKYNYTYDADDLFYDERGNPTHVKKDTIEGLSRVYDYGYSLSASTNIYGTFIPKNPNSRIKGIRHKITPTISFNYRPDFGKSRFGYWKNVQVDSTGRFQYFDVNAGGIYGGSPSRGASGSISFGINNNLEMKVVDTKDTTNTEGSQKTKKVKLIDNLSLTSSYDLIADSMNLAPFNIRARTTVAGVNVNMGATLDPYMIDDNYQKINKYVWNERKGIKKLGRLTQANLSFSMNFSSDSGKKKKSSSSGATEGEKPVEKVIPAIYSEYADFNIPWNLNFDYSFNYSGPSKSFPNGKVSQTLRLGGNFSLTQKWQVNMNTNFDINAGQFAYTTFNVSRDLHCWRMAFNFVPFGYMKSYSFTITADASMLKDLHIEKQQSFYDNF